MCVHGLFRSESANQLFDEDDLSKQKNQRMATLLGFSTDPSREALLEELVKKGILAHVRRRDPFFLTQAYTPCATIGSFVQLSKSRRVVSGTNGRRVGAAFLPCLAI